MTQGAAERERYRAEYRAGVERRYRQHLLLGPERCPCNMCRRNRGEQ